MSECTNILWNALEKMPNKTLKLSKNSEIHEYMRFKKIKWKILLKLLENL